MFVSKNQDIYLCVYIDNILLIDSKEIYLQSTKNCFNARFKISDLDSISHYLDISIIRSNNKISFN